MRKFSNVKAARSAVTAIWKSCPSC